MRGNTTVATALPLATGVAHRVEELSAMAHVSARQFTNWENLGWWRLLIANRGPFTKMAGANLVILLHSKSRNNLPTQSIIVYRNPLEQQMWEGLMSGSFFPVIVGVVVFFAVFLTINRFVVEKYFSWHSRGTPVNVALAVSAVIGVAVAMYMA